MNGCIISDTGEGDRYWPLIEKSIELAKSSGGGRGPRRGGGHHRLSSGRQRRPLLTAGSEPIDRTRGGGLDVDAGRNRE